MKRVGMMIANAHIPTPNPIELSKKEHFFQELIKRDIWSRNNNPVDFISMFAYATP